MKNKTSLALFLALSLAATTAFAGSFSRGGSSFSRSSSSFSSPSRSIGYQRPSVPTYTAPRPSTSPSYSSPPSYRSNSTTVVNHGGGSGSGGFLSSMAGGFTGSMLGNIVSQPHGAVGVPVAAAPVAAAVAQQPMAMGESPVAVAPAPVYIQQQQPSRSALSSFGSFLWGLLGVVIAVALLAAVIWVIVQVVRAWTGWDKEDDDLAKTDPFENLPFSPVAKFIAVQKAFAARDVATLRTHLHADMLEQALDDLPEDDSEYTLADISYAILETGKNKLAIKFSAKDKADGTYLNEVWNFRRTFGSSWQLVGIEQ